MSITKPAAANPTTFGSSVTSLFRSYIGFSSCNGNGGQVEIVATNLIQINNVTLNTISSSLPPLTAAPSLYTTVPSSASNNGSLIPTISSAANNVSSGFTTKDKAATGVVVPLVAIIAFVTGVIFHLRRRRKRDLSGKGADGSEEETQPYLQRKAELEAEEKRRLELEAVDVRYEMDGQNNMNEMPADVRNEIDTIARPQISSLKERQELRGEECSRELEAP